MLKNLRCLEISGQNYVEDIEEFALADSFELVSLEALYVQWYTEKVSTASSVILNKNFSNLKCVTLIFDKELLIEFNEPDASKYNMQTRWLHLSNVEFGEKATTHFPTTFKYLEILYLDFCKINEPIGGSLILELPKLKGISISKMSSSILAPLFEEEHKLYSRYIPSKITITMI